MSSSDTMTDNDLRIGFLIEQKFYETGEIPSHQQIAELLGLAHHTVKNSLDKTVVKEFLKQRGIVTINADGLLTVEQAFLVGILLDTFDRRGIREKLKSAEEATGIRITHAQYQAWMNDPNFRKYLARRAEIQFKGVDSVARSKLVALIEGGNLEAIKYYNEMTNVYNPRKEAALDVSALLIQVLEILTKLVSAEVLAKVADELERLAPNLLTSNQQALPTPVVLDVEESAPVNEFAALNFQ